MEIIVNGEHISYSLKEQRSSNGTVHLYPRAYITVSTDPSTGREVKQEVTAPNLDKFCLKISRLQHTRPLKSGNVVSLNIYLENWLSESRLKIKPTTLDGYQYNCDHYISDSIGNNLMTDISEDIMLDFYEGIMNDHGIPTAWNIWYMLNPAFEIARKKLIIYDNPHDNIRLPAIQKEPIVTLTEEECKLLTKYAKDDIVYGDAITLTLMTALRISECIGLAVDDYDPIHKTLKIHQQINELKGGKYIHQNTTKTSQVRIIHLNERSVSIIEKQLVKQKNFMAAAGNAWHNEYNCMFTDPKGSFLKHQNLRRHLCKLCGKFGRDDFKYHHLRHTCASIILEQTNDIHAAQEILGHLRLDSTGNYLHTSPEKLRNALTSIADYIFLD